MKTQLIFVILYVIVTEVYPADYSQALSCSSSSWTSNFSGLFHGSCENWLGKPPICKSVIQVNQSIYVPNNSSQNEVVTALIGKIEQLKFVSGAQCRSSALALMCLTAFPECSHIPATINTSAINIPRPVCLGVCTNASLHCEEATLIEVPDCSQNLTITSAGGRVHKYPLFPNGSIQLPCSDFELPCTAPQDSATISLNFCCPSSFVQTDDEEECTPRCPSSFFTDSEYDSLSIIVEVNSWLGIGLSMLLLAAYISIPNKRKFPQQLVIYPTLCSIGLGLTFALTTLLGDFEDIVCDSDHVYADEHHTICVLQGGLVYYFGISLAVWWCIISVNTFVVIRYTTTVIPKWRYWSYHVVGWGFGALGVAVGLSVQDFKATPLNVFCFLDLSDHSEWAWILFFGPLCGLFLVSSFFQISTISFISKIIRAVHSSNTTFESSRSRQMLVAHVRLITFAFFYTYFIVSLVVFKILIEDDADDKHVDDHVEQLYLCEIPHMDESCPDSPVSFGIIAWNAFNASSSTIAAFLVFGTSFALYQEAFQKLCGIHSSASTASSESAFKANEGPLKRFFSKGIFNRTSNSVSSPTSATVSSSLNYVTLED